MEDGEGLYEDWVRANVALGYSVPIWQELEQEEKEKWLAFEGIIVREWV